MRNFSFLLVLIFSTLVIGAGSRTSPRLDAAKGNRQLGKREEVAESCPLVMQMQHRMLKLVNISNQDYANLEAFFKSLKLAYTSKLLFDLNDPEVINNKRIRQGEVALSHYDRALQYRYAGALDYGEKTKKRQQRLKVPALCIKYISKEIGYGLFADQDFKKGDFIGEYCGVVTSQPSRYSFKYNCTYFDGNCCDKEAAEFVIAPRPIGNETQFINHHEAPNVELVPIIGCDGRRHIILIACRKIAKGKQLYINYGEEYWQRASLLGVPKILTS